MMTASRLLVVEHLAEVRLLLRARRHLRGLSHVRRINVADCRDLDVWQQGVPAQVRSTLPARADDADPDAIVRAKDPRGGGAGAEQSLRAHKSRGASGEKGSAVDTHGCGL